ncbi:MAG TPA: fused MFS/spermidine synthase [Steroidobacteraceae bacterium]|nr:fused MFS/spermidine synthase [Steroidobacteraceae bacterium]
MSRTTEAVNRIPSQVSVGTLALLCGCFVLSGIAALIYQTAWTRQFAIVFGTSELAVATVLAAYMGGLALGAALAERFLPRVKRPVLTYGLLELGIAGSAIVIVPLLLSVANIALQSLFGGQPTPPDSDHTGTTLFYLLSAFVALVLPTTLMGATLPVLARYAVAEEAQIGRRIGLLYAMNTAGAVGGALIAAFVLLPALGLARTVWVGAALNAIVFLLAIALARRVPYTKPPKGYSDDPSMAPPPAPVRIRKYTFKAFPGPAWVLPLMLLAGAVAFFQEVLWARMLSHVVGSSIYAFGVMVASFLTGIALGGVIGAAVARTRERATVALGLALVAAAAAAAMAYLHLEDLLPSTAGLLVKSDIYFGFLPVPNSLFSGLLLLPMTVAIGMTYPLAVRVLASDAEEAAPVSARVYAWNTVGAIAGSLAAGFILIPALKYEGAIRVAVFASAALGVAAVWVLFPVNRMLAIATTAVAVVCCAFFRPQAPMTLLVTSPLNVGSQHRVLYYDIGRSASVVMLSQDGGLGLRTNGLPEALMESPGSLQRFSGEFWLSPLAVIARPQATDMLIVGYGGGVVIEGVPPTVRKIDVIELEPKVIEANRATSALRKRNPLTDPRVNIILNDARGALRLTNRRYDAIVSQPSHPWTAGASHLYTREFMQLAHDHLNLDGVFVQWMNVIFMDEDLMRSLTATLLSVFREVRIYRPDPNTVVFLASDQPLNLEVQLAQTGNPLRGAPLHYGRFGINNVEDLLAALVLDAEGARSLAAGAPLITDDDNRIATSSIYERGRGMTGDTSGRLVAAMDPLQRAESLAYGSLKDVVSFPYIARRISVFAMLDPSLSDRVARMAQILAGTADGEYLRAFYYRMNGQTQRASELMRLGIDAYPADDSLRLDFLRGSFSELALNKAPPEIVEVADGLSPPAAGILAAARHAARNEWREVAMADAQLAEIPWTHLWYSEAVELRVNWRIRITNEKDRKRFGDEAILMIDRLAIMSPTLQLYGLRTRAGIAAGRPEVVVESVSNYARLALGMMRAGINTAAATHRDARALTGVLDETAKLPGADAARITEVRAEIKAISGS